MNLTWAAIVSNLYSCIVWLATSCPKVQPKRPPPKNDSAVPAAPSSSYKGAYLSRDIRIQFSICQTCNKSVLFTWDIKYLTYSRRCSFCLMIKRVIHKEKKNVFTMWTPGIFPGKSSSRYSSKCSSSSTKSRSFPSSFQLQ